MARPPPPSRVGSGGGGEGGDGGGQAGQRQPETPNPETPNLDGSNKFSVECVEDFGFMPRQPAMTSGQSKAEG